MQTTVDIKASNRQKMQIAMLRKSLAQRQPFTEDDYRDLLEREYGVRSSTMLSSGQASACIRLLASLGAEPKVPKQTKAKAKPASETAPSDPDAPINKKQQHVITYLFRFLQMNPKAQLTFTRRVVKQPWAQNHRDGQKLIYALITTAAPALIKTVKEMDCDKVTEWEYTFLKNTYIELLRFVDGKGQRGKRTMPAVSMTKLFEILEKRK